MSYTRKEINSKIKEQSDKEVIGMLEEYKRLRHSYIPQLQNRINKKDFPHKIKPARGLKLFLAKLINKL